MPQEVLKAKGWKSIGKGPQGFRKCPNCSALSERLTCPDDGYSCAYCRQRFPLEQFTNAQQEVTFAECSDCGDKVLFTPLSESCPFGGPKGYLCCCGNYVAVLFEGKPFHPQEIMALSWNHALSDKSIPLSKTCYVGDCETTRDWQVISLLQVGAKEEYSSFRRTTNESNEALLLFDPNTGDYLGYLLWHVVPEYAILAQLFVVPEQRRKGYAEAMVKHWVENCAKPFADIFALEDPNEYAQALHIKLGHLRREGGSLVCIGCVLC
jgi:GNAT superfamily N-acetyltransferase/DNA-directed RNA polymerase subunit RPC12/RpoP